MATASLNATHDAARIYTRPLLAVYDTMVMRVLDRLVWRCPSWRFTNMYDVLATPRHLEIGVGTGYCLDRTHTEFDRLALVDLNPNCLDVASARLDRYAPTTHVSNVLESVSLGGERFSSIALGGVLHCLPGSMQEKARVFDNLHPAMTDDCVVFGYSMVSDAGALSMAGRLMRAALNRLRVINNYDDTSEALRDELESRFDYASVTRFGGLAFFVAGNLG